MPVARPRLRFAALLCSILVSAPISRADDAGFESPLGVLAPTATENWAIRMDSYIRMLPNMYAANRRQGIWTLLNEVSVVWPVPKRASVGMVHDDTIRAQLYRDDWVADGNPVIVDDYYLGARLLRWTWQPSGREFRDLRMHLEARVTTWALGFDERKARTIPWPTGQWPIVARSALEPQLFVEPNDDVVQDLLRTWVGPSPKRLGPVVLAKTLAAHVIDEFQPSSEGYEYNSDGRFAGFKVEGAAFAARVMRGTPSDQAALLCALYRAAGLPARVVIGYDLGASIDGLEVEDASDREFCQIARDGTVPPNPVIRPWVEFFLYDEAAGVGEWIPVDVQRQREVSSRAYPLDMDWLFFGNMPCGDLLIPLSFHFHPPDVVVSPGPPALWGWIGFPETPRVEQNFNISSTSFGLTADDMP